MLVETYVSSVTITLAMTEKDITARLGEVNTQGVSAMPHPASMATSCSNIVIGIVILCNLNSEDLHIVLRHVFLLNFSSQHISSFVSIKVYC